jgi:hypothetical protein
VTKNKALALPVPHRFSRRAPRKSPSELQKKSLTLHDSYHADCVFAALKSGGRRAGVFEASAALQSRSDWYQVAHTVQARSAFQKSLMKENKVWTYKV